MRSVPLLAVPRLPAPFTEPLTEANRERAVNHLALISEAVFRQDMEDNALHRSWLHVAHVTQHDEADVTDMEAFRKAHDPEARAQGFKLTPVAFQLKAAAATLRAFPTVNSSLDPSGESSGS